MTAASSFFHKITGAGRFRKRTIFFLILLLFSSLFVFIAIGKFPLIDWDEAIYADVARNTLSTGHWLTLTRFDLPWFEKPPLYIWFVMASIKLFGISEFALRLPSAVFTIASVLLLYLLVLELSDNEELSFLTALVLLFTPPFYLFGTQSRMDTAVTAAILFSVFCFVKSITKKRWLIGLGIGIGLGVLTKSIIGFLAFLPILSYGIVYHEWSWIKNKYLWVGLGMGLLIATPWHIYETIVYGGKFWSQYFFIHVFQRGITIDMQGKTIFDYLNDIWVLDRPWSILAIMLPLAFLIKKKSQEADKERNIVFFGIMSSLLIFSFFAVAKTKMWAYLVPAYPFLAIFIGVGLYYVFQNFFFSRRTNYRLYVFIFAAILLLGAMTTLRDEFINLPRYYFPYIFDEKAIGSYLKDHAGNDPIFLYKWQPEESLRFYSGKTIDTVYSPSHAGSGYLITVSNYLDTLYYHNPTYNAVDEIYKGPVLVLLRIP